MLSDYITATELTEAFMRLVPVRTLDWPDGSGAAQYELPTGPVVMLWDSQDNPILCDAFDAVHAALIWQELTKQDAESWAHVWECVLCDYPDGMAMTAGDLAHLMGEA